MSLVFESNPWLIPLCVALGAIYAFILYQKNNIWSKQINWALALVRFLLASLLALLLLNFLIKKFSNSNQAKTIVFAIDNSQSVGILGNQKVNTLLNNIKILKTDFEKQGYEIEINSFTNDNIEVLDSIQFNQKSTNLSQLLANVKSNTEGKNVTNVILISDGIINIGSNASSGSYAFPIHTIGIGDTVSKRDIILKAVNANKVAYQGNDFTIQAEVAQYGFDNQPVEVLITQGSKTISTKSLKLNNNFEPSMVEFTLPASLKGMQQYTIMVRPKQGEFSVKNNSQNLFIDIIEGKEKILLLALSPHPDIKALKAIIEKNNNYTLTTNILSITTPKVDNEKYDLIICHQIPDEGNISTGILKKYTDQNLPVFYILGNKSAIPTYNNLNTGLRINSFSGSSDKANANYNNNFKAINFDSDLLKFLERLPPLIVPYANFENNAQTVFYQKIGNSTTEKPLLVLKTEGLKSATLLGEGLWQWRMEEYALTEKQEIVDDVILKILQFISAKEDKRKLKVYPLNKEFNEGEPAIFETEIYNDVFQKTFNQNIKLEIADSKNIKKVYNYTNLEGSSQFQISGLQNGVYKYIASTSINGKAESVIGQFAVKNQDIETTNVQADFEELKKISLNTGGSFNTAENLELLKNQILNTKTPDKLITKETLEDPITLPWLFFLLITLATIEWGFRKYLGAH